MVSSRSSRKHCDRSGWSSWFCAAFDVGGGSRLATRAPVVVSTGSAYAPMSCFCHRQPSPLPLPPPLRPPLPSFALFLSASLCLSLHPYPSKNPAFLDDQQSVGLLRGLYNFRGDRMSTG
ncbi:hypothetical protein Trydic_g21667 [Trypoxylus dichotomus]